MISFFLQNFCFLFFYRLSSILRNIIFTTAAIDNIDHNPTNTTVTASLHGTSILPAQQKIIEKGGCNK